MNKEQASKFDTIIWRSFMVTMICIVFTQLCIVGFQWKQMLKMENTNRLLSTFQRMDVVKENSDAVQYNNSCSGSELCHKESPLAGAIPYQPRKSLREMKKCDEGFVEVKDTCYPTIGLLKKSHHDSQSDPNLCYSWRADCDDNGQCDVTCHLQKE